MRTPAQRQAAFRARRAAADLVEVRGIFLPLELHVVLKRKAADLQPLPLCPTPIDKHGR